MRLFKLMETAYSNFDDTVKNYLAKVFDSLGMNSNHTQVFTLIFDGIKGIMQNAMYYIEDAFTEQNIYTAVRKKSIYSLAKISGYEPYYGSAASGTLIGTVIRGSLLDSDAIKIFIPNNAIISNRETGIRYILQLNSNEHVIDITKPLTTHQFKISEGVIRTNYFAAQGKPFETFSVYSTNSLFDKAYIEVYVNGERYYEAASMYDMNEGANEYVITVGYDSQFEIMFGDGIYGNILSAGDSIEVKWISHNGSRGNILGTTTTNFVFETLGRDTYGNDINLNKFVSLKMYNCISGGTDADSIENIRKMIGYSSRSLVLATEENFKLFLKRFSFIGKVNCWSHENTMQIIVSCLSNKITDIKNINEYFDLSKNDLLLSVDQKQQILTSLENSNRVFAGISVQFKDPSIWRYAAVCILKIKDAYNKDAIKEEIKSLLGQYFIDLDDGIEIIYRSDIIQYILNKTTGIISFDIQFISEKNEVAFEKGHYDIADIDYRNGQLIPKNIVRTYTPNNNCGLDMFGNIKMESKLEIPILQGGFNYFNKDDVNKGNFVKIETIQYVFI